MSKKKTGDASEALSRQRTADLLHRLRDLRVELRTLNAKMGAAQSRELQTALRLRKRR